MAIDRTIETVGTAVIAILFMTLAVSLMVSVSDTGVTYDGNGGITDEGEDSYLVDSREVRSCDFVNGDMDFREWNTEEDGTGIGYYVGDTVGCGCTLYAIWA